MVLWTAEEMGVKVKYPMEVLVDNAAGISFQQSTNMNTRLKGIFDLRLEWCRELRDKRQVKAVKVGTQENISDLLTKCHSGATQSRLVELVGREAKLVAAERGVI